MSVADLDVVSAKNLSSEVSGLRVFRAIAQGVRLAQYFSWARQIDVEFNALPPVFDYSVAQRFT